MDQYEILDVIGQGSFGRVCKIRRKHDRKDLVWKEITYSNMTSQEKQRIVDEVNILRGLRHPFIVKYYDRIIDKTTNTLFILMEYCPNGDLRRIIKGCKRDHSHLEERFIWKILTQLLLALKDCHHRQKPILHRDIKPANILLDKHSDVKLGDFGLAKELQDRHALANTNVGTPYYMSPEVVNHDNYDERSDIWALGCVIYEACALVPPFEAPSQLLLAHKINIGKYNRIPSRYSDALWKVIKMMLQKDISKRARIQVLLDLPAFNSYLRGARAVEESYDFNNKYSNKLKSMKLKEEEINKREQALLETEASLNEREQQLKIKHENLMKVREEIYEYQRRCHEQLRQQKEQESNLHHQLSVQKQELQQANELNMQLTIQIQQLQYQQQQTLPFTGISSISTEAKTEILSMNNSNDQENPIENMVLNSASINNSMSLTSSKSATSSSNHKTKQLSKSSRAYSCGTVTSSPSVATPGSRKVKVKDASSVFTSSVASSSSCNTSSTQIMSGINANEQKKDRAKRSALATKANINGGANSAGTGSCSVTQSATNGNTSVSTHGFNNNNTSNTSMSGLQIETNVSGISNLSNLSNISTISHTKQMLNQQLNYYTGTSMNTQLIPSITSTMGPSTRDYSDTSHNFTNYNRNQVFQPMNDTQALAQIPAQELNMIQQYNQEGQALEMGKSISPAENQLPAATISKLSNKEDNKNEDDSTEDDEDVYDGKVVKVDYQNMSQLGVDIQNHLLGSNALYPTGPMNVCSNYGIQGMEEVLPDEFLDADMGNGVENYSQNLSTNTFSSHNGSNYSHNISCNISASNNIDNSSFMYHPQSFLAAAAAANTSFDGGQYSSLSNQRYLTSYNNNLLNEGQTANSFRNGTMGSRNMSGRTLESQQESHDFAPPPPILNRTNSENSHSKKRKEYSTPKRNKELDQNEEVTELQKSTESNESSTGQPPRKYHTPPCSTSKSKDKDIKSGASARNIINRLNGVDDIQPSPQNSHNKGTDDITVSKNSSYDPLKMSKGSSPSNIQKSQGHMQNQTYNPLIEERGGTINKNIENDRFTDNLTMAPTVDGKGCLKQEGDHSGCKVETSSSSSIENKEKNIVSTKKGGTSLTCTSAIEGNVNRSNSSLGRTPSTNNKKDSQSCSSVISGINKSNTMEPSLHRKSTTRQAIASKLQQRSHGATVIRNGNTCTAGQTSSTNNSDQSPYQAMLEKLEKSNIKTTPQKSQNSCNGQTKSNNNNGTGNQSPFSGSTNRLFAQYNNINLKRATSAKSNSFTYLTTKTKHNGGSTSNNSVFEAINKNSETTNSRNSFNTITGDDIRRGSGRVSISVNNTTSINRGISHLQAYGTDHSISCSEKENNGATSNGANSSKKAVSVTKVVSGSIIKGPSSVGKSPHRNASSQFHRSNYHLQSPSPYNSAQSGNITASPSSHLHLSTNSRIKSLINNRHSSTNSSSINIHNTDNNTNNNQVNYTSTVTGSRPSSSSGQRHSGNSKIIMGPGNAGSITTASSNLNSIRTSSRTSYSPSNYLSNSQRGKTNGHTYTYRSN